MIRRNLSLLILAGLVTVSAAAIKDAVTIKRTPTKGQKISYTVEGKLNLGGMEVPITGKGVDTVTEVAADGTFTVESQESDTTINGQKVPDPTEPTKVTTTSSGLITELTGSQDPASTARFQDILIFVFPDKPMNVGDTWKNDVKPDAKLMAVPYSYEYKLVGDEKVGSYDAWKIEGSVKETEGSAPASATSTYWISKTDGSLVKQKAEAKNVPFGGGASGDGSFTMTRTD